MDFGGVHISTSSASVCKLHLPQTLICISKIRTTVVYPYVVTEECSLLKLAFSHELMEMGFLGRNYINHNTDNSSWTS